jgi:hypothetical protein
MANTRDTKRIERLLALAKEKAALLREEILAGTNYEHEYHGELEEIQTYSSRLKEVQEWNAHLDVQSKQSAPPEYNVT